MIDALCAFDADVDVTDVNGQSPLILAVLTANVDCVRALLNFNPDTTKTTRGRSALHTSDMVIRELLVDHLVKSVRRFIFFKCFVR